MGLLFLRERKINPDETAQSHFWKPALCEQTGPFGLLYAYTDSSPSSTSLPSPDDKPEGTEQIGQSPDLEVSPAAAMGDG